MLSKVAEKRIHVFRYVLVVGWLILILSLFYDPISSILTDPTSEFFSPFKDGIITRASSPETCVLVQGECLSEQPYPLGTRLFWGMFVPCAIAVVFILGHETWRRICPLYFLSQIPRALRVSPKSKVSNNRWLSNNHLYLQFALFF